MCHKCVLYCVGPHFSIEVICETGQELALNGVLSGHEGQIVCKTVVGGDYNPLPLVVVLGPSSTTKDLQHVKNSQINKRAFLSVINLSSL